MTLFFYIMTDVVHFIKIFAICELFLQFSRRKWKAKYLSAVSTVVCTSAVMCLYEDNPYTIVLYWIALSIFIGILYVEKIRIIVAVSAWIIIITAMLDIISVTLIQILFNNMGLKQGSPEQFISTFISLAVVLSVGLIYKRGHGESIMNVGIKYIFIFTLLTLADAFAVMEMAVIIFNEDLEGREVAYSVSFVIAIIGMFIQLSAVILLLMSRNSHMEKEYIIKTYLNEQKEHYEYLEEKERMTKKFRHDIRNHMQILSTLMDKDDRDGIEAYMRSINVKVDELGNAIQLGNDIIDAIVNRYFFDATGRGIDMRVNGHFPADCDIEAYDLCTIFSNILSNAVEASEETDEKEVAWNSRYTDSKIIVVVDNSISSDVAKESDRLRTKKNPNYHGFGIENIKDCVEKNKGSIEFEIDGNKFTVIVILEYRKGNI